MGDEDVFKELLSLLDSEFLSPVVRWALIGTISYVIQVVQSCRSFASMELFWVQNISVCLLHPTVYLRPVLLLWTAHQFN